VTIKDIDAIVADGRSARLARRPTPRRRSGWAQLRVLLAGICRTDVHAAEGLLPLSGARILGHEMIGEIEEVDSESAFAVGARVTVTPLVRCGTCAACARDRRCSRPQMLGVDLDGAFAERIVVPEACLVRVPRELPLRRAAYVEPLAATLAVTRAPIHADQHGIVLGSGRIADLTNRVLRAGGFALNDANAGPLDDAAFDFVVDAAGTDDTLAEALRIVVPGGVIVLKSRPPRHLALDVARAVRNDVTLSAVSYGSFSEAVSLAGELAIDDLLGDVYRLDQFEAAMTLTRERPLGPKLFLSPRGET
jgi:threonine dehydrogenase-like Zn-dependent dehydrogenase